MEKPLQAMRLADDVYMWDDALRRKKKISIRMGHHDYHPGPVILCSINLGLCAEAMITSVLHTSLAEVPIRDIKDNSYGDHQDAIEGLRRFYPTIQMDSPVTVIRWNGIKGAAVDDIG
jgi:hypothetical protein